MNDPDQEFDQTLESFITDQFIRDILSEEPLDPFNLEVPEDSTANTTISTEGSSHSKTLKLPSSLPTHSPRLCHVCNLPAGKHNYYGGQVCESCRAFFRRSIQNQTHPIYQCKALKNCIIDSKSRKSCTWCRFKKCLFAGMNPKWIITDQERKTKLEAKRGKIMKATMKRDFVPIQRTVELKFTIEEQLKVQRLSDHARKFKVSVLAKHLASDLTPLQTLWKLALNLGTPTVEFIHFLEEKEKSIFKTIALGLEEMTDLDLQDRETLVQKNSTAFFALIMSIYFNPGDFGRHLEEILMALDIALQSNDNPALTTAMETLEVIKMSNFQGLSFDTFYSNCPNKNVNLSKAQKNLMGKIQSALREIPNQPIDTIITCIVILNLIFASDGSSNLKDSKKVERIQNNQVFMLHRYLRSKFGDKARAKMGKLVMLMSYTQEAYSLHRQMVSLSL
ncbi:vitamin D3 receptor-like [Tigriopus californicus]|uniref:vitamin D3 receptor-like n=1 Tax=Tigriopus californicus TaxID=6832 RepID=UPI0027DA86C3|nr:vitamin D3 receptor-like [Tigriopus californicus]